jgi:hypothetical protein
MHLMKDEDISVTSTDYQTIYHGWRWCFYSPTMYVVNAFTSRCWVMVSEVELCHRNLLRKPSVRFGVLPLPANSANPVSEG